MGVTVFVGICPAIAGAHRAGVWKGGGGGRQGSNQQARGALILRGDLGWEVSRGGPRLLVAPETVSVGRSQGRRTPLGAM